ncbi:hypothetical protein LSH36_271g04006 [Paralvinella palmiformis]|uniref:Uncharacterized protein n=1 Tax=Paralvinella palmiformis TaxID=53620 RepID=A0AAD9N4U0_9ANNE|nr:hypothetical protein LSH36_271g04006 [Paralvinella palmiformis]
MVRCFLRTAKVCQTFIVSGAMYNLNTNGYYDVTGHICSGRVAYERVNGSVKYYLYYGNPDDLYYGWNIGEELCGHSSVVYNLNNNRRPDYTFRYWIEKQDESWYYNFGLRVTCTEGLSFAQLIGVVIGSIIGTLMIIAITAIGIKQIVNKQQNNRRTSPSCSRAPPVDHNRSTLTAEDGLTNFTFRNDDDFTINQMMPAYVMSPPEYNDVVGVLDNGVIRHNDVDQRDSKPPSYEEAIASLMNGSGTDRGTGMGIVGVEEELHVLNTEQRPISENLPAEGAGTHETDGEDLDVGAEDSL